MASSAGQNSAKLVIKMLTKTGCGLCDQSLPALRAMKAKYPLASFRVVNIDDLQEYHSYKNEVPVMLINEVLFSKFTVNPALLEAAVAFQYKKINQPSSIE